MPGHRSLLRPFRRDNKADFEAGDVVAAVRSAVGQILGTIGASDFTQGELPWRLEFGSLLRILVHQRNDALLPELARVYAVEALKRWEPRVHLTSVSVAREWGAQNVLAIRLRYDIVAEAGATILVPDVEQTVRV